MNPHTILQEKKFILTILDVSGEGAYTQHTFLLPSWDTRNLSTPYKYINLTLDYATVMVSFTVPISSVLAFIRGLVLLGGWFY